MENFIKQLKQGDIIFHHAHDCIANIIRRLDHPEYNHCSIYDKDGYVYEVVKEGVVRKHLKNSIRQQKTYSVTNYRPIGIPDGAGKIIIENIEKKYLGRPYAKVQLVLLWILFFRKLIPKVPTWLNYIKIGSVLLMNKAISIVDRKNKYLICSELIYRTYRDACVNEKDMRINLFLLGDTSIIGDQKDREDLHDTIIKNGGNEEKLEFILKESGHHLMEEINQGNSIRTACDNNMIFLTSKLDSLYGIRDSIGNLRTKNPGILFLLRKIDLSNFISPGDISNAVNLEKKETFFIKKRKGCDYCYPKN